MRLPVTVALIAGSLSAASLAHADDARYTLANDCWTLQSTSSSVSDGPFFLKPTDLGSYMFYDKNKQFLSAADASPLPAIGGAGTGLARAADGGPNGDWTVDDAPGGTFKIMLPAKAKALGVQGGKLALVDPGAAGQFKFAKASGCAEFPESGTSTTGTPSKGKYSFGDVRGFIDAHIHMMAFEFLGGDAHCGKPWDRYGITHALVDCPDHQAGHGAGAALEVALGGKPFHDPVGWPTFKDWPAYNSLTHEDTYWKWVERAWRGGLRMYVNLLVDNGKLCDVYPLKRNPCDEMNTIRLEAQDSYKLQDYIDAQYGGPGKGWFRIVRDPFEARKVINEGKLAVVLGIENSRLFDCREQNDVPQCSRQHIDQQLDQVYAMGVRDMEIVNKFDNALTGVAGDNGTTGVVVNGGQKLESNHFWDMKTCTGPDDESDHTQPTLFQHNTDALAGAVLSLEPPGGATPIYGPGPHCNTRGLTDLGRYLIERMIQKRMIFDPDHMSVLARKEALDLLEAYRYPGVVSSHSWSTPDAYPRIYKLGGFVAPYAGDSTSFVKKWQALKPLRDKRYYWGIGYGADMNGFGGQGAPRLGAKNPVTYPFKSFDGAVTIDKEKTGQRTWDINTDGVAHYGLYPDWIQDLRMQAGNQIVADMARGSEAYLEMWERAVGVPATTTVSAKTRFGARSYGKLRLGDSYLEALMHAGQPATRRGRVWTWNVAGGAKRIAVLTPSGNVGLIAKVPRHGRAKSIAARGVSKKRFLRLAHVR